MIKKSLVTASLLFLTSNVLGNEVSSSKWMTDISLYPSAPGETLNNIDFDDTHIVAFKFGKTSIWNDIGLFASFGMTANQTEEDGSSVEPYLEYKQYGVGANYSLTSNFILYAGVGLSEANGTYTNSYGDKYETTESVDETYTTIGGSYIFGEHAYLDLSVQSVGGVGIGFGFKF